MQVPREHLINKLRDAGFAYKKTGKHYELYKRGVDRIEIPRRQYIEELQVRRILYYAGLSAELIQEFISCTNS